MRLALHYSKKGPLKYLSHLDVQRLWQRVFHIVGLEPEQTQGFNPHPKLRFALPLATGYYSEAEVLEIFLVEDRAPEEVVLRLNSRLPRGMEVIDAAVLDSTVPKVTALITGAGYRLELERSVQANLGLLLDNPLMVVNEKEIDLPKNILGIASQGNVLNVAVKVEEQRAVRPELLVQHLYGPGLVKTITRRHLFAENQNFLPPGMITIDATRDYVDDNS